jgi:hypothetical protein
MLPVPTLKKQCRRNRRHHGHMVKLCENGPPRSGAPPMLGFRKLIFSEKHGGEYSTGSPSCCVA